MEQSVAIRGELGRRVRVLVSGYEREEALTPEDANWLRCSVDVEVGGFRGAVEASFMTQDFVRFSSELDAVLDSRASKARFDTDEEALALSLEVDRAGHATVSGTLKDVDARASLSFSFETDITFLRETRKELQSVLAAFPQRAA